MEIIVTSTAVLPSNSEAFFFPSLAVRGRGDCGENEESSLMPSVSLPIFLYLRLPLSDRKQPRVLILQQCTLLVYSLVLTTKQKMRGQEIEKYRSLKIQASGFLRLRMKKLA
mmetsp:Transcript_18790/g.27788  ORF Transcript_18790/g.27788 Transcript_18790/m.27788 type:complete len:112 (-) Transcript_18790:106-441(-)